MRNFENPNEFNDTPEGVEAAEEAGKLLDANQQEAERKAKFETEESTARKAKLENATVETLEEYLTDAQKKREFSETELEGSKNDEETRNIKEQIDGEEKIIADIQSALTERKNAETGAAEEAGKLLDENSWEKAAFDEKTKNEAFEEAGKLLDENSWEKMAGDEKKEDKETQTEDEIHEWNEIRLKIIKGNERDNSILNDPNASLFLKNGAQKRLDKDRLGRIDSSMKKYGVPIKPETPAAETGTPNTPASPENDRKFYDFLGQHGDVEAPTGTQNKQEEQRQTPPASPASPENPAARPEQPSPATERAAQTPTPASQERATARNPRTETAQTSGVATNNQPTNISENWAKRFEEASFWSNWFDAGIDEKIEELRTIPQPRRKEFMKAFRKRAKLDIKALKLAAKGAKGSNKKEYKFRIKQEKKSIKEFNKRAISEGLAPNWRGKLNRESVPSQPMVTGPQTPEAPRAETAPQTPAQAPATPTAETAPQTSPSNPATGAAQAANTPPTTPPNVPTTPTRTEAYPGEFV